MNPIISIKNLNFFYDELQVLRSISMDIQPNAITALIGPSGCGKTTLLRCLNRMNELIVGSRMEGEIIYHNTNIYNPDIDPVAVRRKIGMVFQKPNPFPKSIYENIAWGARINGYTDNMDARVEKALHRAGLWDEVKDKLKKNALSLSGGQQQRLCIARAIAVKPDVILMDEPTSALDPISSSRIEELMNELKERYAIVIVTHNMQQAGRVSDNTAFLLNGELVEYDKTSIMFVTPKKGRTEAYLSGKFG